MEKMEFECIFNGDGTFTGIVSMDFLAHQTRKENSEIVQLFSAYCSRRDVPIYFAGNNAHIKACSYDRIIEVLWGFTFNSMDMLVLSCMEEVE